MYSVIFLLLFIVGVGVYLFAPIDEMRDRAKHAISQSQDIQLPVKEMVTAVMEKKDELFDNKSEADSAVEISDEAAETDVTEAVDSDTDGGAMSDGEETIEPEETTAEGAEKSITDTPPPSDQ